MAAVARPRGPLPARVYWVRRAAFLTVLLLFVGGIFRLVGVGGDEAASPTAQRAASQPSPTTTPTTKVKRKKKRKPKGPVLGPTVPAPVLAQPEGTCAASDITVVPSVPKPIGGSDIKVMLNLKTKTSDACNWKLSASSVTVAIRSGGDDIWSTQQCRNAIPTQNLVVRDNANTQVAITWSAKRSDETCSRLTQWAMPGWYFIKAAALGGDPAEAHFELELPTAGTITRTVTPTATATPTPKTKKNKKKRNRNNG